MNDRIKDYFAFNRKEQRGLIILLVLLLISLIFNVFIPQIVREKEYDISAFEKEVSAFLSSNEKLDSAENIKSIKYYDEYREDKGADLTAFIQSPYYFDPNDLSEPEWVKMGIGEKIARNITHYRQKGGKFKDKEGFKRIYGMNDSIFASLEPFIRIKETEKPSYSTYNNDHNKLNVKKPWDNFKKFRPDTLIVELNSADSALLLACRGIGPSFAGRIIKYRDLLGGFTRVEQLLEVRGMDSIRYSQINGQFTVNPQLVRKIDLNKAGFKELLRHPYFEYYLVKAIFTYKEGIKAFDSVEQLRQVPVMYEELYEKISPYMSIKSEK